MSIVRKGRIGRDVAAAHRELLVKARATVRHADKAEKGSRTVTLTVTVSQRITRMMLHRQLNVAHS